MFAHDDPRLQVLIGVAGVDTSVCYRLFNGQRRQVAIELGFSGQEIEAIMGIEAETLSGFARGLLGLTQQQPGAA